ncbi:MAG: gliding motility-associated ABC transporter permease subunit GldF [Bacteroidetes bacterium]|jgi:ABC-2 type transport system permease protein|nr:gliding motility-associated ABC transporter permease subunit GldF [Bacteroidota bacterium]MBT6686199.1 gliding motility-associated ABC transporter permease subunit GldF [Bacteroidota bacterium]MBT7143910.1 gliding motility-associated ABC transporter permease subunit GldF [Bacteroidota bacterium]MBT7491265.1 gliding motility-associated ABC transporter permease subunit GldF [Bacteroidota bacterium]
MFTLYKKEIRTFFSSLTGYIVIIVFLLANSLFLWIFPGEFNVLDGGYANIDTLFIISPWIFMFLVPAVTMRLFAEEKRSGTIEILLTQPLSDIQIILAKYFAGLTLVLFSLLPSLIYFLTVYLLGSPVGNIDIGATWGSYIGLFFLAAIYVSIGLFASSITENQIVSFIVAILISFFIYIGFESISNLEFVKSIDHFILNLGINEHYRSMSRGVIDLRDIIYFVSAVAIFTSVTKIVLESRKW